MDRRKFLKMSGPLATAPLFLNGSTLRPFASPDMLQAFTCTGIEERALVIIQMAGGNDGLNTIVPVDQYSTYKTLRPNIALDDTGAKKYIDLDTSLAIADQVGLHPNMTDLKTLYDQGKVNIIQGVSYTNQNRSHFKSTDLYLTGGDGTPANFDFSSGWIGRYLEYSFPGVAGNPTPFMPDPLGIQLGNTKPSLGFHTESEHAMAINLSGQNPADFQTLVSEIGGAALNNIPISDYGNELSYIMSTENSVGNYATRITSVFNNGSNTVTYPNHYLASQLKTVARLLAGGSKTKIFLVTIGGFDTHAYQTDPTDSSIGDHADRMTRLSESIKAFQDDLAALNLEDKVLTATFSEFGRKPGENGNYGTDHGTLAPVMLFGSGIQPGITGTNVDLSNLDGDQIQGMQYDYRQVFTTLLQDWLGADDSVLTATKFDAFKTQKIPIVDSNIAVDPSCYVAAFNLPIELSYFKATAIEDERVELVWQTASETNNDFFEIERSADGSVFERILEVRGAGNSTVPIVYREDDLSPLSGVSYYRLKQIDFDGTSSYSEIVSVKIEQSDLRSIKLYPNPAIYDFQVVMTAVKDFRADLRIVNSGGITVRNESLQVRNGFNKFNFDVENLPSGSYFVQVDAQNVRKSIKLMVNK